MLTDGRKVITIAHPEQSSGELKIRVSYFFMRNPYKKFQNRSIHGSKVMLCIKKRDERTDGRTEGRTDKQPRSNMPLQLL